MEETKKTNKSLAIFVILTMIFAISTGYLGVKVMQKTTEVEEQTAAKDQVIDEKQEVLVQLQALKMDYEQMSSEYSELDELFQAEKKKVEKLMKDVKKGKSSIETYKKQVYALKEQLRDYLGQIEVLKERNQALNMENIHIKSALDSTTSANQELAAERDDLSGKVEIGSMLKAYDIIADGIRIRGTKEIPTKSSKRVEKIRLSFILSENPITKPGNKEIYVRIARPDGKILTSGDNNTFVYKGEQINYSTKGPINYKNQSMDLSFYFDKVKDLPKGSYFVDLFVEDYQIGTTKFILE